MTNFENVINRFKQQFSLVHDSDMARAIGIEPGTFWYMRKKGNVPSTEILEYLRNTDVNPWYIFYGDGSARAQPRLKLKEDAPRDEGCVKINYNTDGEPCGVVDTVWLDKKLLPENNVSELEASRVRDGAMEPKMRKGDIVFIDYNQKEVIDGGIYLVRLGEKDMIRRIFLSPDGYIVKTQNKDYPDFEANNGELKIVGLIKFAMERVG